MSKIIKYQRVFVCESRIEYSQLIQAKLSTIFNKQNKTKINRQSNVGKIRPNSRKKVRMN